MTESLSKADLRLRWIAFILTIGELGWAISSSFHGDMWALYLTITYWIRETKGGAHYHEIVVDAVHIVYIDCRRRFTVPRVLALTHEPVDPVEPPEQGNDDLDREPVLTHGRGLPVIVSSSREF